jgi:uncharacterized protein (DUF1778 family)
MPVDETTSQTQTRRDSRLNIRATNRQDALIRRAAEAVDKSVTEFVLESASVAAEQVLADRRFFVANEESWQAFEAALDRPAVFKPRLKDLLDSPSPFREAQ